MNVPVVIFLVKNVKNIYEYLLLYFVFAYRKQRRCLSMQNKIDFYICVTFLFVVTNAVCILMTKNKNMFLIFNYFYRHL